MLVALVTSVGIASGARFLRPFSDYRVFFGAEDPRLAEFERLQNTYTKIDNVFISVSPKNGEVFSNEALAAVEAITEDAWKMPFVTRVDSITNFQHTTANGDDLVVRDLVKNAEKLTEAELERIRRVALAEPALVGRLITEESRVTGINVTFQFLGEGDDEQARAVAASMALAKKITSEHPVELGLSGMVMLNDAFNVASISDMTSLVPLMYLVIILVSAFLLRSATAVIGTVVVMVLSMATGMGIGGFFGVIITPPSSVVPTIVAMLAVADCVHFIVSAQSGMRDGMSRKEAVRYSMNLNLAPIFLTSVTTAIGFLTMNFSDSPPFHHLGNMAAFGVIWALVLSVTFLPAFLAVVPISKGATGGRLERLFSRFAELVTRRKAPILVASVVVSLVLIAFLPRNALRDDFVRYFQSDNPFRQAVEFTDRNLTGVYQLQYSLSSGQAEGVSEPSFQADVARFADFMRRQPSVRHVSVITDTFARLNKNMHGDDPDYYRLPDRRDLAAQYLLLYELSLPYGLDLNNQLNVSKSSTHVIVTLSDVVAPQLKATAQAGEAWLAENTKIVAAKGVGPSIMFAYISERNIQGMVWGIGVALALISLLLMVALRSLRIGFISLVPNILPPAIAFGIWGLTVAEVNVGVSLVTGLTLGIVVDDTVHFLSKYLAARRDKNLSPQESVRYAFSTVGIAILTTSVILVAGFMILAQSTFGMNRLMSQLTAIAIACAFVADFLLLPTLLLYLDRDPETSRA